MNLVDAAVEILRARPGEALSVEELVRLASEQGLLDKPPTPASMKGRLATELKKGEASRLERVDGDLWRLREAGAATPEAPAGEEDLDDDDLDDEDLDEDEDFDEEDDDEEDDEDEDLDEDEDDFDEEEVTGDFDEPVPGTADENVAEAVAEELEELAEPQPPEEALEVEPELEPEPIPELPVPELEPGMEEILTPPVRAPARRGEAAEPAEDQALALYAEETESGAPLAAREYRDERTADEDRPMLPEISSGRRDRGRNRRDERRREREERRKARDARRGRSRGEEGAAPAGEAAVAAPVEAGPPAADDLAAAAAYTLQQLRDTQPVQVKQLAQMMRKRKLLTGDPERVWPHLRAALLHDERAHRSRGLRPRVVGRGRDLFALPGGKVDPGLAEAEQAVARAALALEAATRRVFAERLARLALPGLEQVANIWLIQSGYTDIDWIKRVDRSSYASARAPDLGNVLVGVRAGDQPVDRRGVGELRAGVAAKGLAAGVLLSGRPLSAEALAELEKGGKPVLALCGDALVTALLAARVGVQTAAVPVIYLDVDFFEELARG